MMEKSCKSGSMTISKALNSSKVRAPSRTNKSYSVAKIPKMAGVQINLRNSKMAATILCCLICCFIQSCEAFSSVSNLPNKLHSMTSHAVDCIPPVSFQDQKRDNSFVTRTNDRTLHLKQSYSGRRRSVLQMSSIPYASTGVVAAIGALSGGLFAGSLHAVSGPDHLAALMPKCCGQRWYKAGKIGILWGLGHGLSATILGAVAFALKNRLPEKMSGLLHGASSTMEIIIGISLLLIGFIGIKESREWQNEIQAGTPQSLSAAATSPEALAAPAGINTSAKRAVIFNGILHGLSWDGAPSLAPALAVATWRSSLTFLFSYSLGTIATMGLATVAIGEGTRRAGQILHRPDLPQKVGFVSSWVAIAVGLFWIKLSLTTVV